MWPRPGLHAASLWTFSRSKRWITPPEPEVCRGPGIGDFYHLGDGPWREVMVFYCWPDCGFWRCSWWRYWRRARPKHKSGKARDPAASSRVPLWVTPPVDKVDQATSPVSSSSRHSSPVPQVCRSTLPQRQACPYRSGRPRRQHTSWPL